MASSKHCTLTELVNEKLPMRVRMAPEANDMSTHKSMRTVLLLKSVESVQHVIATRPTQDGVLSIPLHLSLNVSKVSDDSVDVKTVLRALKPLYACVNSTWKVEDVGIWNLPSQFSQTP
ncbi:uncharacterized protein LOC144353910 isoform X1 [Saccoglossus kowalevskii]